DAGGKRSRVASFSGVKGTGGQLQQADIPVTVDPHPLTNTVYPFLSPTALHHPYHAQPLRNRRVVPVSLTWQYTAAETVGEVVGPVVRS
ncbi:hypothetical protein, partial [Escherichia coli]|uniref:hypothetical protein n=1 Tax=Escherichia coli TaxID=562 RepID=UPI001484C844